MGGICGCSKIDSEAIKIINEKRVFSPIKQKRFLLENNQIKENNNSFISENKSTKQRKFNGKKKNDIQHRNNFLNTEQNELEESLNRAFSTKKAEEFLFENQRNQHNLKETLRIFKAKQKKNGRRGTFSDLNQPKINLLKIYGKKTDDSLITLLSMNSRELDRRNELFENNRCNKFKSKDDFYIGENDLPL